MSSKAASALAVIVGVGVSLATAGLAYAEAPTDTTGQPYQKARVTLKGEGYDVVVSGRSGDQVSLDDCLVAHQSLFTVKRGHEDRGKTVHVTLRCYKAEVGAANKKTGARANQSRTARAD